MGLAGAFGCKLARDQSVLNRQLASEPKAQGVRAQACSYLCYLEIGWDASPEEMLIFNESDGEDSFTQTTTSSLSYREGIQRQAGRNAAAYSLKAPTS